MPKLNNKGYLTIEIILASVLAMSIAFFLIEITAKLINKTDDYNRETLFLTDKALIIKNIKNSIEKDIEISGEITNVSNDCILTFNDSSKKQIKINTNGTIKYGDYTKKINEDIKGEVSIKQCSRQEDYIVIQININDIFTDENRDINIVVYNG